MLTAEGEALLVAFLINATHEGAPFIYTAKVDGRTVQVEGHKRCMPQGTFIIELLKPESTKECFILEGAAWHCIKDAIIRLVRTGELFATPLRLEWGEEEPIVWSLAKRGERER